MVDALLAGGCARFGVPGAQLGLLCAGVLEAGGGDPVLPSTPFLAVAFDDGLLYLRPFALPRAS